MLWMMVFMPCICDVWFITTTLSESGSDWAPISSRVSAARWCVDFSSSRCWMNWTTIAVYTGQTGVFGFGLAAAHHLHMATWFSTPRGTITSATFRWGLTYCKSSALALSGDNRWACLLKVGLDKGEPLLDDPLNISPTVPLIA